MPSKGQILINPLNGDTYEYIETAQSSNGAHVTMKATIHSKGELVPNHFHVLQDESFEIISGTLTYWYEGETRLAKPGDKLLLPKNQPHNHFNNHDEPVVYIHHVSPALDFDYLIETLIGLASDGKMKNGKAGLLQELVSLKYLDSKSYLAGIPVGVQNFMMTLLAPIGRMMGKRAIYKKYSGIEK